MLNSAACITIFFEEWPVLKWVMPITFRAIVIPF